MTSENMAQAVETVTQDELEALIARFTLEYLHRWTNNFDPAALAEFKKVLDKAGSSADLVRMLRSTDMLARTHMA